MYDKKILPLFGHEGITKSSELQRIGNQLFGSKFIGVFAQNCLPFNLLMSHADVSHNNFQGNVIGPETCMRKCAIVNVDKKRDSQGRMNKGSHWVAVACFGDRNSKEFESSLMIFDSFGRPSSKLLKHLYNQMKKKRIISMDTQYDAEEKWYEENCGQLCMAWLKFFDLYGANKARTI